MTGEVLALALTLGVHVLGACALIGVLMRDSGTHMRDFWPSDGDDDGPGRDPQPQGFDPAPGGRGVPLPDAEPAPVRLREPGRLGDAYPRPTRRPAHAPEREPTPH